jgi:hypothetical protein
MVNVGDHDYRRPYRLGSIVHEGDIQEANPISQAEKTWDQSSSSSWRYSSASTETSTSIFQTFAYDANRGKMSLSILVSGLTISQPLVAYLSLYTGFAFAMIFSFFASYNAVFQDVYHFDQKEVGLTFIGILIGFLFAVASFGIFDATLYQKATIKANGRPAPEHRLYAAMLGSFMLPIGLFWFAWAPNQDVHCRCWGESLSYFRMPHESFLLRQTPEKIFIKPLLTPPLPRDRSSPGRRSIWLGLPGHIRKSLTPSNPTFP